MKNRFLLCLLLCAAMFYIALPRLDPSASGLEGIFAISWIVFALIVAAGNLSALLFSGPKQKKLVLENTVPTKEAKRIRAR